MVHYYSEQNEAVLFLFCYIAVIHIPFTRNMIFLWHSGQRSKSIIKGTYF